MKLGIITIHNVSNYGAVLQSYALKEIIKKKHDVQVINFDNKHVSKSLEQFRFGLSFHGLLCLGKDVFRVLPRYKVINKFNEFLSKKMDMVDYNEPNLSQYDGFISGSDQIWNPACVTSNNVFIPEYFLTFSNAEQFKISYASSCGAYEFNKLELMQLQNYLKTYKSLSVREAQTCEMMREKLKLDVEHVIDPTLLLTKDQWLSKLGDNNYRKGSYILLYVIKNTPLLKKVVKYFKTQLNIKVILVEQGLYFSSDIDEHIRDAGPEDFISLFNNAEYVITDSFHGTTFSLIFNKQFLTVSPGKNINRIESLLSKLNLKERIVYSVDEIESKSFNFSFEEANKLLASEIFKSKDYLERSLS